jgi:hypothetical protein
MSFKRKLRRNFPVTTNYKQWSGAERDRSYRLTVKAIKAGEIPPATDLGCNRCKQTEGIIHYHNHDYSHPTKYLEPLCWRCHMILHSIRRNPEAVNDYWSEIFQGKQYPPVFKHDFSILRRDHGIN